MKAALFNEYGPVDVLKVKQVPVPAVEENTVLVRVHGAGVNPKDTFVRKGRFQALSGTDFPQVSGYDYAGIVEETGPGITHVKKGDRVYGYIDDTSMRGKTAAEYVLVQEHQAAVMPSTLDFIQAASLPCAALTALQSLRDKGNIKKGDEVCVNGASGGVGTFAVQIAAACFGARVTAICSESNHQYVKDLGAEEVIDYSKEDIAKSDRRFHIFFDVFGNYDYKDVLKILHPGGSYVTTVPGKSIMNKQEADLGDKHAELIMVQSAVTDLETLAQWLDQGLLKTVIHRVYPLEKIREAHEQIQSKHTRGKVVLEINK